MLKCTCTGLFRILTVFYEYEHLKIEMLIDEQSTRSTRIVVRNLQSWLVFETTFPS